MSLVGQLGVGVVLALVPVVAGGIWRAREGWLEQRRVERGEDTEDSWVFLARLTALVGEIPLDTVELRRMTSRAREIEDTAPQAIRSTLRHVIDRLDKYVSAWDTPAVLSPRLETARQNATRDLVKAIGGAVDDVKAFRRTGMVPSFNA
ncbi:hypothetical protein ACWELJ_09265 [Nocardia sp. NPDC004582]